MRSNLLFDPNPGMYTDVQSRLSIRVTVLVAISFLLSAPIHSQNKSVPDSAPKKIVDQSISGTVYRNGAGRFTLTVPAGWKTDVDIVEPKFGIGGLISPDNESNISMEQIPTEDSPSMLAKKLDASGSTAFRGYRKLGDAKLKVAGRSCEVLTFSWIQERTGASEPIELKLAARFVFMPNRYSVFAFKFVTHEALLYKELPTFEEIVKSFHSTAPANLLERPK